MARIQSDSAEKIFLSILGLNCSGTTIISKFFDSLENGFCLSEPLHNKSRQNSDFLLSLKKQLLDSDYLLGGIKEVFINNSGHDRFTEIENNFALFDLSVLILRHPFSCIGSILPKAGKNRSQESLFEDSIKSYERLFDFASVNDSVILSYEEFCANPIEHVNSRLPSYMRIIGPLALKAEYGNYTIGNHKARKSTSICSPIDRSGRLSLEQKSIIEERIIPTYKTLA